MLILCGDVRTEIKEAIVAAFPKIEYQRCIVHWVRDMLKYVPDKDRKAFATSIRSQMKRKFRQPLIGWRKNRHPNIRIHETLEG